jgi:aryl-alcohol dehydrogenase-like predicted oxidoreductase
MDQRPLGQTGVSVSTLCLGTMMWPPGRVERMD